MEMTAVNGNHQLETMKAEPARVGLTHLFASMPKEVGDGVVKKALAGQLQVSGETRAAFRKAVGTYVTVDGFRNSELAPPPLLQEPVSKCARDKDDLAAAVLRVWVESQRPLRERVDAYLRGKGLLNGEPDYSSNSIAMVLPDPQWDDAIDGLVRQNPETNRDDMVLMSTYISGRFARAAEDTSPSVSSPPSAELSGEFQRVLDLLRTLSPDASQWDQDVAEFVDAIRGIRERKHAAAQAVAELDAQVVAIAQQRADLLKFFEWDADEKLAERSYPWADMEAARQVIGRLSQLMGEYAPLHPIANVRSEEMKRGPQRASLQEQIDAILAQFEALEVQTPQPPPPATETSHDEGSAVSPVSQMTPEQPLISGVDLASLRAENQRLSEANRSLGSDNGNLRQKTSQLSSELGESRNLAENWRRSYQDSRRSQALVVADPLPDFESVAQTVQLAQQRFSSRLNFQLNAKSDTSIPFDKPRQVWDALEWLATVYCEAKTRGSSETDLDLSLRQVCGWHYTPSQSPVTMGQYREYYEAWVRGRKRELHEHIGTGNGYHRGTIRIAFTWDADEKKLVIGYIGRHQRTDAS
jgi:hypothetical protein